MDKLAAILHLPNVCRMAPMAELQHPSVVLECCDEEHQRAVVRIEPVGYIKFSEPDAAESAPPEGATYDDEFEDPFTDLLQFDVEVELPGFRGCTTVEVESMSLGTFLRQLSDMATTDGGYAEFGSSTFRLRVYRAERKILVQGCVSRPQFGWADLPTRAVTGFDHLWYACSFPACLEFAAMVDPNQLTAFKADLHSVLDAARALGDRATEC